MKTDEEFDLSDERSTGSILKEIVSLTTPIIISLLLGMGIEIISLFYVGRLGDPVLIGASGIATTLMNVVVMSTLQVLLRGLQFHFC